MKSYIIFLLVNIILFQSEWIRYSNSDSDFSVLVPGEMEHTQKEILTDVGAISFNTFQYTPIENNRNELYIVHHYLYPDSLISSDSSFLASELLEATIEQSVVRINGVLDYSRPIQYKDYQGILYRIKYNRGKAIVKTKAFVIGDNFYFLQVYATIDNSINNLMDYFLDSFQHIEADN